MSIENRVEKSGLIQIDLEKIISEYSFQHIDLKTILFGGLAIREKDLKDFISSYNWEECSGKIVCIYCSEDVIIPTWVFMRLATKAFQFSPYVFSGNMTDLEQGKIKLSIDKFVEESELNDAKVVVKGCSSLRISENNYTYLSMKLTKTVRSLMYGEPCSTVPIYKKPKN